MHVGLKYAQQVIGWWSGVARKLAHSNEHTITL